MTALDAGLLLGYLLLNLITFGLMGLDKWRACRGGRRVPERTLLAWCAAFGGLGGWLGMQVFRHKTRKRKFTFAVPALLLLQLGLLAVYYRNW